MKTKANRAMFAIAVGDALARVWGENDPAVNKVTVALASHDDLRRMIRRLLGTCELNLDEMEAPTRETISAARSLLVKTRGR